MEIVEPERPETDVVLVEGNVNSEFDRSETCVNMETETIGVEIGEPEMPDNMELEESLTQEAMFHEAVVEGSKDEVRNEAGVEQQPNIDDAVECDDSSDEDYVADETINEADEQFLDDMFFDKYTDLESEREEPINHQTEVATEHEVVPTSGGQSDEPNEQLNLLETRGFT